MSTDQLAPAFVAALGALTDPAKDGRADVLTRAGDHYAYTYLTLPQLLTVVRPVFAAHGLAVSQTVERTDQGVAVTTTVLHTSGETLVTPPLELRCGPGAQDVGSAITYARRYTLAALVGLAGDDDDGARAQQSARAQQPPRAQPASSPEQYSRTRAKRAVLDALDGEKVLANDLWTAADPGAGPFTPGQVDELVALAHRLIAGTAHLEASNSGNLRVVVHPEPDGPSPNQRQDERG